MGLIDEQKALIDIDKQLEVIFDVFYENPENTHLLAFHFGKLSQYVKYFLSTHDIKLKDDK